MNFEIDTASLVSHSSNFRQKRSRHRLDLGGLAIAIVCGCAATALAQTPGANATLSMVNPGGYALTLNNTGSTTVGTFWYSWVPGKDFMPGPKPTLILSPPGWTDTITGSGSSSDGYAIQWTATSAANDLAAGGSLSGFGFDSSLSAAQVRLTQPFRSGLRWPTRELRSHRQATRSLLLPQSRNPPRSPWRQRG